jgi:hypothetical protein
LRGVSGLREVLLARCVKCHGLRVVRNQLFDPAQTLCGGAVSCPIFELCVSGVTANGVN